MSSAAIRAITGSGVRYAAETSALPAVLRQAIESLMPGGMCTLLGSAPKGTNASFEMPFLQQGRSVRGVVQGDSVPKEFIPKLVDLVVEGKFPIEKMITFYELADINLAAQEFFERQSHQTGAAHAYLTSPRRAGRGRAKRG